MGQEVFNRYEIISRLAVGGMGEVFLARESATQSARWVVVKRMLPELAANEESGRRFVQEARVAAQLSHPNIVTCYEVGRWRGELYIVMEYVRGHSLSVLLRDAERLGKQMPLAAALRVAHDAASGLAHAHRAHSKNGEPLNVIHRDVNPMNIMVREDGVSKIIDFGIARTSEERARTASGLLRGKIGYVAPEQIVGQTIDARTDQFGLGVTFWEMLTGRSLYARLDPAQILKTIADDPAPPIRDLAPHVPEEVEAMVLRMLRKNPKDRYNTCSEIALRLRPMVGALRTPLVNWFTEVAPVPVAENDSQTEEFRIVLNPIQSENFEDSSELPTATVHHGRASDRDAAKWAGLPRTLAYLDAIEGGLDGHPNAQVKASAYRPFFAELDVKMLADRMPEPLADLLINPRIPSSWVTEVRSTALFMAGADILGLTRERFVELHLEGNTRLLQSRMYRVLVAFLSPMTILKGGARKWGVFHRGGLELEMEIKGNTAADVAILYPKNVVNDFMGYAYVTPFLAAFNVSGGETISSEVLDIGETRARFRFVWQ